MYQVLNCLVTEHDWRLVLLAGSICTFASAVAISLFHRARASHGRTCAIWICLDAAVGGCGIWATHFVAMLAYGPGGSAGYNIPITLLSLVFAIAIVAIGLCIALLSARRLVVAIGGAVIGAGVAAMHYTGMAAVELPAFIVWSPGIVSASVVLGSVFAALAMLVAVRRDDSVHTLAAGGLLTVAIVSHHFTAMGAVTLVPDPTLGSDALTVSPAALSFLTSIGAFAILGISLLAAMFDRAAKGALHQQKILLDSAIDNMSQGLCMFDAEGRILLFNQRYVDLMDRTGMPLQGRLLIDVLREVKAVGEWDGDPEEFFAAVVADARAGKTVTKTLGRNGRSLRVVDQPMKGGGWVATFEDITEWQAVRQIGQRVMARHVRDLFLGRLPFGDVFERGNPSAALHGLLDHAERTSAAAYRFGHGLAGFGVRQHRCEELVGIAVPFAGRFHFPQNVDQQAALKRHAGPIHEFDVALVEQEDAALRIEHAKSLRHVCDG